MVVLLSGFPLFAQDPVDVDVLLRGGLVFDGTGAAGRIADVAIKGDKIVGVGAIKIGRVGRTIDCTGLYVTPGFIDLHTHSDSQVTDPALRASVNYVLQGCTTQVTGNCGSGPVDVGAFYKKIDDGGAGTNVAHLLPQGSLRNHVAGDVDRKADADELKKMEELTEKAMQDGAWGMSTGLIYVPSVYASTEELITLATVVGRHGGIYASHIRGEGTELLSAVGEAMRIGKEGKLPAHISHFKAAGQESWGTLRLAAELIEQAQQRGEKVTADQYPYTASSTSLEATIVPTWARSGGSKELIQRLGDSEIGPKLRKEIQASLSTKRDGAAIYLVRCKSHPEWIGKNLVEAGDESKQSSLAVALEILRHGGAAVVNFSMSEDDVRMAMQRPWVATASDGRAYLPGEDRPHPRNYGTFARKIGRYSLKENVIPIEHAVRSCSGLPADIIGLKDRGYLKPDFFADVVVFDPKEYIDAATFDDPHQYARGTRYVFVNGHPAVFQGVPTGTLAGRALRHPSPK
ncbi:MAG TPA: D-aminoacylase [Planctomycetaceae bacterium]|nr:D-aminoacylase [Planctomycetaceae bacterium]